MAPSTSTTDTDEIKDALERVLANPRLDGSERLKDFLTYIVEEEAAGRGEAIKGKTIAIDVFGRDTTKGTDPVNAVRVEARRLRQMLEQYYQTDGRYDQLRIHIDTGAYRPRFERVTVAHEGSTERPTTANNWSMRTFLGGLCAGALATAGLFTAFPPSWMQYNFEKEIRVARAERAALYDKSPTSLQAFNLADQARRLLLPLFDRQRQLLALSVFQQVIELDPEYHGGYAGSAQALAMLSMLAPSPEAKAATFATAADFAETAVQIAPTDAWSQSAKSWVAFAQGDYDVALDVGRRAVQLDPEDGHVLDYFGTIALFTGNFAEADYSANRDDLTLSSNQRFARRNITAAANYHLGHYNLTVVNFEQAAEFGDPISAPTLAYHAAALAKLGRVDAARTKLDELEESWPSVSVRSMLTNVFSEERYVDEVLDELEELGWSDPNDPVEIPE